MLIDEVHLGEVPARVAHQYTVQVPERVRHFEAVRIDDDRAVATPLGTPLGAREGQAQRRAVRARAQYIRARRPAGERRLARFTVDGALITELGPGLGGFVQELEREVGNALEHRQQLPFDRRP